MGELPDMVTRVEAAPARIGDAPTLLTTRNALVQGRTGAPGYVADPRPPCPVAQPDIFLAEVHTGGAVVTVNMRYCYMCTRTQPGGYNSRAGVEAVVRGLRLRR